MQLDYDYIKELLKTVKETSDGFSRNDISRKKFTGGDPAYYKLAYHYKILMDNGLVYGSVLESATFGGNSPVNINYTGLTMLGHQTLEAMLNDTIWNKIKGKVKELGDEGLSQIPGLALGLLVGAA